MAKPEPVTVTAVRPGTLSDGVMEVTRGVRAAAYVYEQAPPWGPHAAASPFTVNLGGDSTHRIGERLK